MTIDRRSFVQTAALAVGGAAAIGAASEGVVGVAQAQFVAQCPGPFKPSAPYHSVDDIRKFLDQLYDAVQGPLIRDGLWNSTQDQLRVRVKEYLGFQLDPSVKVIVCDLQNGRYNRENIQVDPKKDCYYNFVLPPTPPDAMGVDAVNSQKTEQAYHHSVVYGYGI